MCFGDNTESGARKNFLIIIEKDSHLECCTKSDGKLLHVDINREVTEGEPTLSLLPQRSEEDEVNDNGETRGGNVNVGVRSSNRTFKPPERRGIVPHFLISKTTFFLFAVSTRKKPPKPKLMKMEGIDSDYGSNENK